VLSLDTFLALVSFAFVTSITPGVGLGAVFAASPVVQTALKIIGAVYMVWLAWKIANAGTVSDGGPAQAHPISFVGGALFQAVNPKAWVLALGAMALYVRPDRLITDVVLVTIVFALVGLPCVALWTGFGHVLRNLLRDAAKVRVFNIVMAALLVASIVPMVV
jgi:threonine/homoserine/homoserine lactone efflux protein